MRRPAALALVLWLAGCAGVAPPRPDDPVAAWRAHQAALQAVSAWKLRGKVGLRGGRKNGQASVVWTHREGRDTLRLFGPFGGGLVQLEQTPAGAVLRRAKGNKIHRGDNARALLLETTGWDIPFEQLRYWILGLPAPGPVQSRALDPWGRLARLEQAGWVIRFESYRRYGDHRLPRRLRVESRRADAAGVRVQVVVKRWEL